MPVSLCLWQCRPVVAALRGRWQSSASRSVIHPTRLETRTKESNMCASRSVLNRLERRNESKRVVIRTALDRAAQHSARLFPSTGDLSEL